MAAVPGVLLIGDFSIQGGGTLRAVLENIAEPQTRLGYLGDRTVMRIVPDDPTTGEPTGAFRPWYDWAAGNATYTVGTSSATTITVSPSPTWTANEFAGRLITVVNSTPVPGLGYQRRMVCVSNTADTLTFASGTVPTVGNIFFIGIGRMRDYHAAAGWITIGELSSFLFSTRGGSSAMANGQGVGCDATLVRELTTRIYPTAPWCYVCKYANVAAIGTSWADAPNNAARAPFLAELARMDAAATADGGNTIAWDVAVIDMTNSELSAWGLDPALALVYKTRFGQFAAWLRTTLNNPDLLIVVINHRDDVTNAGAPFIRGYHREMARDEQNLVLVDMQGAKPGVATDTPSATILWYAQEEYFRMGKLIADRVELHKQGVAGIVSNGLPLYLMLGDSIAIGEIESGWTANANSRDLSGPNPPSLLRPANQIIWNRGTGVGETYLPHTNSNTSGSATGTPFAGPELSIMAELGARHPDGFILVKRGSYSSTLAAGGLAYDGVTGNGGRWTKTANEHYPELLADFQQAVQWVNAIEGKQVDVRGAFVILGHNDQAATGGDVAFEAALGNFCRDLWDDFSTRTDGHKFPILWRQPMTGVVGENVARMAAVRAALQAQADAEPQFGLVDVDGLEVDRVDGLHETPETAVTTGRRMVAALRLRVGAV